MNKRTHGQACQPTPTTNGHERLKMHPPSSSFSVFYVLTLCRMGPNRNIRYHWRQTSTGIIVSLGQFGTVDSTEDLDYKSWSQLSKVLFWGHDTPIAFGYPVPYRTLYFDTIKTFASMGLYRSIQGVLGTATVRYRVVAFKVQTSSAVDLLFHFFCAKFGHTSYGAAQNTTLHVFRVTAYTWYTMHVPRTKELVQGHANYRARKSRRRILCLPVGNG